MKIEVLGAGCKSCDSLYENVCRALESAGMVSDVELEKITDIDYFAKVGLFTTPGLVVDGELIASGRVLEVGAIANLLKK
ncbi:MAG: MTH895/ArsE family thioredoxin-like protein [Desulfobacterales bacterium]|nr:MTH895/ArsE family thioredoxin-like protein [Desulfobacterales bacterium]